MLCGVETLRANIVALLLFFLSAPYTNYSVFSANSFLNAGLPGLMVDDAVGSRKRVFRRVGAAWFTSWLVEELEKNRGACIKTSLDMGLTWSMVCVSREGLVSGERLGFQVSLDEVKPRGSDRVVVVEKPGVVYEVARWCEEGFYKLKAVAPFKAPTLEIKGIHMHRIVGTDPWSDTRAKILDARIRRGHVVLDTCMGLGYTAIQSVLRGASRVVTIEVDPNVIWVAERNPWSHMLSDDRITLLEGDATRIVSVFPDECFDRIIHDPPRLTGLTGDLYSLEFYQELYRVLKTGGVLYHYTGEPGKHGGISLVKGVGERLRRAGFTVWFSRRSLGYVAVKQRL